MTLDDDRCRMAPQKKNYEPKLRNKRAAILVRGLPHQWSHTLGQQIAKLCECGTNGVHVQFSASLNGLNMAVVADKNVYASDSDGRPWPRSGRRH